MRRTGWMVAALAGAIAAAPSCRNATEIIVDISTDAPCADVARGGTLVAGGLGRGATSACTNGEIGTLAFVPSAALDDRVLIQVTTGLGRPPDGCHEGDAACIVARRSLRYVPHDTLRLPVVMHLACAGVTCPADQTCGAGGVCSTADVDAPGFAPEGDGGAQPDAARDATASDAGDAAVDAPLDGAVEGGTVVCDLGTSTPIEVQPSAMSLSADALWIVGGSGAVVTGNFARFDRAGQTKYYPVDASPFAAASNGVDSVFWANELNLFYYQQPAGPNAQFPSLSPPLTGLVAVPGGGAVSTQTEIWLVTAPTNATSISQTGASLLAADPGAAPWGLFAASTPSQNNEEIDHLVAGSPTHTVLVAPAPGNYTALAANRSALFMARANGSTELLWLDRNSGSPATLIKPAMTATVTSIAASESSVFWVEKSGAQSTLFRSSLPLPSTSPGTPVATGAFIQVVADALCAYYVAGDATNGYSLKSLSP